MAKAKKTTKGKQGAGKKAAAKKPATRKKAARKVEAVPARYGTATPHLIVSPCGQAMEFYKKAFGARLMPAMQGPGAVTVPAGV